MRRRAGVAVLLAILMAGCACTVEEPDSKEASGKPVWDLRQSHRIEDVGWPEGHEGSTYKVDPPPGALTILLPEGVTIEGPFDVIANRPLLLAEGEDRSVLEYLVVNYDREPVREAARRAAELARQWGIDASRLAEWAARNANGQDLSPGGTQAHTPPRRLEEGGPSLDINARALPDGRAYLSVTVSWYDQSDEEPSAPA